MRTSASLKARIGRLRGLADRHDARSAANAAGPPKGADLPPTRVRTDDDFRVGHRANPVAPIPKFLIVGSWTVNIDEIATVNVGPKKCCVTLRNGSTSTLTHEQWEDIRGWLLRSGIAARHIARPT
jgi:hypothetical protein